MINSGFFYVLPYVYLDSFLIICYICDSSNRLGTQMFCKNVKLEDVFESEYGAVRQCNNKNCYWLYFNGTQTKFTVRDLFLFKNRVDQINIEKMLTDSSVSCDFEIIMPFRTERCFVLSVCDIVRLKELLKGAKFMIELNSEIKSCLNRGLYIVNN